MAVTELNGVADELDRISEFSINPIIGRAVREHIRSTAVRIRRAAEALAGELDQTDPDIETLGLLRRVGRRAGGLLLAGSIGAAIVGGVAQGVSAEVASQIVACSATVDKVTAETDTRAPIFDVAKKSDFLDRRWNIRIDSVGERRESVVSELAQLLGLSNQRIDETLRDGALFYTDLPSTEHATALKYLEGAGATVSGTPAHDDDQ